MAAKKSGLGKGLDSLISNKVNTQSIAQTDEKQAREPDMTLKISLIEPNREQPRKNFDEEGLKELADSIRQFGILQPLLVKKREDYYEIVAGERRWRAAKLAGLKEVPVIIRDLSEQEIVEIGLIENLQREDLNPIEEALAYKKLIDEFGLKQEDIAKRVSKNRTTITNSIRLLRLDERVQKLLTEGSLSSGHARCLISIPRGDIQFEAAEYIIEKNLSVRDTESYVKKLLSPPKTKKKEEIDNSYILIYKDMSEQMKRRLGTKVDIKPKDNQKGKIEIEYYSQEDLGRILELINTIEN